MKKFAVFAFAAAAGVMAWADWPSTGGGPARDGWAKSETALSPQTAKDIKLIYVHKFENAARGENALSTPLVLSRIVTWKGFKALLYVGSANDTVYAIDSELGREFSRSPLGSKEKAAASASTLACPGGQTAGITLPGSISAGGRGRAGGGARGASGPARGGGGGGGGRRVRPRGPQPSVYALGSDGWLRWVREQDGDTAVEPAAKFVPANSNVSGLAVANSTVYAATQNECGGPNALYAMDISVPAEGADTPPKTVKSLPTNGTGFAGTGGVAIGADGTVFGQVADGNGSVAGKYSDTVLAMDGQTLAVKDYFTPNGARPSAAKEAPAAGATPSVFEWNGKEVIIAGGRDGRIYLLDSKSLGGSDHHTPLAQSAVIAAADANGNGIWNSFATAEANGARWIFASVNGGASNGSIVAFKVADQGGKPALTAAWSSRDLISPAAPVYANGLVYALSTGKSPKPAKTVAEREKLAKPAVIYVLDAATGKDLWNSGTKATSYATGGIAVADGQFYFSTHDNNVYAMGMETDK